MSPQIEFVPARSAPAIFIVARTGMDWAEVERFEKHQALRWHRTVMSGDVNPVVELCGRLCYLSFGDRQSPKTNAEYVAHLVRQGHESVFEHATWTFILTGVTRAFTHQLVRHRVGFSFSQLSQQYHVEERARFIVPSAISREETTFAAWRSAIEQSYDAYHVLLKELDHETGEFDAIERERRRLVRSAARGVLSSAIETKIAVTANARAVRHFLSQRGALEGDEEMRLVSALLLERLMEEAPALFADFTVTRLEDGSPSVRQKN